MLNAAPTGLTLLDTVTVRALHEGDNAAPRAAILVGGTPTGAVARGAVLEAALRWTGGYLLFMTDDVPFEDLLSIQLFDRDWRLLDAATLGHAYTTGAFGALDIVPPDTVHFHFIGDTRWTLRLLPRPRYCLPVLGNAPGEHRAWRWQRHFTLAGAPRPG